MPYLTPPTAEGLRCYQVYIPDDEPGMSVLIGLLSIPLQDYNWEQNDPTHLTPAETVDLWTEAFNATFGLSATECNPNMFGKLVGEFFWFAGDVLPANCLLCDGADYDPVVYPALFTAIGYLWGQVGDNFKVPNMTERFAWGANGTTDPVGEQTGTNVVRDVPLPEHTHTLYPNAASGAVVTSVVTGTRTQTTMQTQPAGQTPSVIDILPQRAAFLPCIVYQV